MSVSRHAPVAVTGMGLICSRLEGEASRAPARFISVELPQHQTNFRSKRAASAAVSRSIELAFHAAISADGGSGEPSDRRGVAITVSKGLTDVLEKIVADARNSPTGMMTPISECGPDAAARWIARALHLGGPASAAVAACASGLASVKLGMDWLRDGVCGSVLAGAAESSKSELIMRSFERLGVISPTRQTRPFDARRDGFVVGEGAAVFRLEAADTARFNSEKRKGPGVLATILGIAFGADAHHLTTPEPTGAVLSAVVEQALLRSRLEPAQIDWVHAHGTATAYNDVVEVNVLRRVFGKRIPPVAATKGMTGHLLGASGACALGLTIEALRGGFIPAVAGLREPAAEFTDIDFVLGARRPSSATNALVLNHGFGGHLAAVVVAV